MLSWSHLLTPVMVVMLAAASTGGEWPQILGPHRNGVAAGDERLDRSWPADGPPVLWQRAVGRGYAGVAVAEGTVVLFHRLDNREVVEALDPLTGQTRWQDGYPTTFRPQVGGNDGPLCTPTIAAGKVVTFGAQGVLSCYELASGKLLWRRRTHDDFDAREGYFGAGSSPLIEGDRVIVNVGGFRSQSAVVAFQLQDGATAWHQFDDHASYSSPVATSIDGQRRLIVVSRLHGLLMDPTTGAVRAQIPFGQRGPTVNAANPVLLNGHVFLTANYGIGAVYAALRPEALAEEWRGDDLYSSQYCTPVPDDDVLFGIDGRQDGPPGELKCFDPQRRRVLWSAPNFGYGSLLRADGKLVILLSDGALVLATANRERFDPLARARVLTGESRALPALAAGRLYVRDDSTLKCLQVGPAPIPEKRP